MRDLLKRTKDLGHPDLPLLGVSLAEGVRPRADDDGRPAASLDLSGYKRVREGDIIMNALGKPHGSIGRSPQEGITSPAYWVMEPNTLADSRFLHYLLRSEHMVNEYQRLGKYLPPNQFDISWDDFRAIEVPLPPVEEQRRIADFLDDQVVRIDGSIVLRTRQLESLNRVHRGLLPVEAQRLGHLGPSPLPWFPAWDEQWDVVPLKAVARCHDARRVPLSGEERALREGPYPYYGASTIVDHIDNYIFDGNYVLVGEDGASLENEDFDVVQVATGRFWVNNHAHILEATGLSIDFLALYLRSVDRGVLVSGATRPKITQEDLMHIPVVRPPGFVQDRLVAACSVTMDQSSKTSDLIREATSLLEERKRALITAAVTGELDVTTARPIGMGKWVPNVGASLEAPAAAQSSGIGGIG